MSYQQPPTGYNQPVYYPPPGYQYPPPHYYYPPPQTERPRKNETMKALAIIFFAFGLILGVASYIPLIGFFLGLFALALNLLGLIFLCLI